MDRPVPEALRFELQRADEGKADTETSLGRCDIAGTKPGRSVFKPRYGVLFQCAKGTGLPIDQGQNPQGQLIDLAVETNVFVCVGSGAWPIPGRPLRTQPIRDD